MQSQICGWCGDHDETIVQGTSPAFAPQSTCAPFEPCISSRCRTPMIWGFCITAHFEYLHSTPMIWAFASQHTLSTCTPFKPCISSRWRTPMIWALISCLLVKCSSSLLSQLSALVTPCSSLATSLSYHVSILI